MCGPSREPSACTQTALGSSTQWVPLHWSRVSTPASGLTGPPAQGCGQDREAEGCQKGTELLLWSVGVSGLCTQPHGGTSALPRGRWVSVGQVPCLFICRAVCRFCDVPRSKLGCLRGCHSLLASKPCSPNTLDSSLVLGPFSSDHQPYQFMLSLTRGGRSNRESSPYQDAQIAQTRGAQPPLGPGGESSRERVCLCVRVSPVTLGKRM